MSCTLNDRLNEILPRVTGQGFLESPGIGNEFACYIVEYAAADEVKVVHGQKPEVA